MLSICTIFVRKTKHKRMKSNKGNTATSDRSRKIIKFLWIGNAIFVVMCIVLWLLIYNGIIGYMPPVKDLRNPNDKYATRLFTADGVEMGRYFQSKNNRIYADYDEISQNVVNALIATEDVRFESHSGIDIRALSRVLVKTILMGNRGAGGGSTITQQLAKLLYSPESNGLFDRAMKKPVEWAIAVKLERYYTKEEKYVLYNRGEKCWMKYANIYLSCRIRNTGIFIQNSFPI